MASLRLTKSCAFDIDKDILGWTPPPGMKDDLGKKSKARIQPARYGSYLVLNKRTKLVAERVMKLSERNRSLFKNHYLL